MIMGGVLLLVGIIITLGTYFSGSSEYIISYGAILVGAWLLWKGYKGYQNPIIPNHKPFFQRDKFKRF